MSTLDRGRLEYKTDDEGTLYIEWDEIATVTSTGQFEVGASAGRRFVGSLRSDAPQTLVVVEATGPMSLPMKYENGVGLGRPANPIKRARAERRCRHRPWNHCAFW